MSALPPTVGAALDQFGIAAALLADVMPRVDPGRVRLRAAPRWFSRLWAKGITAVTTPRGVYVHPDAVARFDAADPDRALGLLMVHELMHVEQLARLGVLTHTIQYLADYVRGRVARLGHWESYRRIRLEAEARAASALIRDRIDRDVLL